MKNKEEKPFGLSHIIIIIIGIAIFIPLIIFYLSGENQETKEENGMNFYYNINQKLSEDFVGKWTFNEKNNPGIDGSKNGNNGRIISGNKDCGYPKIVLDCPTQVKGKVGEALNFDGKEDYVITDSLPDLALNQKWTIAAWISLSDLGEDEDVDIVRGEEGIYTFKNYTLYRLQYANDDKKFRVAFSYPIGKDEYDFEATLAEKTFVDTGKWYYIVGTWDGNSKKLQIYVNGYLEGNDVKENSPHQASSAFVVIGKGGRSGTSNYFNGIIDEVELYKSVLTAQQIKYFYAQGKIRHMASYK